MKESDESKNNFEILQQEHKEALEKTNQLDEVLTHLRFEGKVQLGKNTDDLERLIAYFKKQLLTHVKKEEAVFSFLQTRIPKLDPLLHLLQAEHKELKVNIEVLEFLSHDLSQEKGDAHRIQIIEKLKEKGTYLIYFLRHHLQVEEEGVYLAIDKDLKKDEKKEVARLLQISG